MRRLTSCPNCGSTHFVVREAYVWSATVDEEDGVLSAFNADSEVVGVTCHICYAEYDVGAFAGIEFN